MSSQNQAKLKFLSLPDSKPTTIQKIDEKLRNIQSLEKEKSLGQPYSNEYLPSWGSTDKLKYENSKIPLRTPEARRRIEQQTTQTAIPKLNDDFYAMNHKYRGRAIIFSHEKFIDLDSRLGTEKDVANLKKQLPRLGFLTQHISVHEDLTFSEINHVLVEISEEDHHDNDCLMVFVLTHGDVNDKIYAKDTEYSVEKIWRHFLADRCDGLSAKPKIFFIIACRGANSDSGVKVINKRKLSTSTDAAERTRLQSYIIPSNADVLTIYSTTPGFYSYREEQRGTWYIEALCNELAALQQGMKINFIDFLTRVNRRVATAYTTYNPDVNMLHNKKQCASLTSTLIRNIILDVK